MVEVTQSTWPKGKALEPQQFEMRQERVIGRLEQAIGEQLLVAGLDLPGVPEARAGEVARMPPNVGIHRFGRHKASSCPRERNPEVRVLTLPERFGKLGIADGAPSDEAGVDRNEIAEKRGRRSLLEDPGRHWVLPPICLCAACERRAAHRSVVVRAQLPRGPEAAIPKNRHIRCRRCGQPRQPFRHQVGMDEIVVVQKQDVVTAGVGEAKVPGRGRAAGCLATQKVDS